MKATHILASRCKTSTSAVFLAATALLLAVHSEQTDVPLQLIVANRFTAEQRSLLAAMVQDGLVVLRVRDNDLESLVQQAYRASTIACCNALYPPQDRKRMEARLGTERPGRDIAAFFNDARTARPDGRPIDAAVPEGSLPELRASSRVTSLGGVDVHDMKYYVRISSAGSAYDLMLHTDSCHFADGEPERMLQTFEELLCEAVDRRVTISDALKFREASL